MGRTKPLKPEHTHIHSEEEIERKAFDLSTVLVYVGLQGDNAPEGVYTLTSGTLKISKTGDSYTVALNGKVHPTDWETDEIYLEQPSKSIKVGYKGVIPSL